MLEMQLEIERVIQYTLLEMQWKYIFVGDAVGEAVGEAVRLFIGGAMDEVVG